MEYKIFSDRIKILDVDGISKKDFDSVIYQICAENPDNPIVVSRSHFGMYCEMCVHKGLYLLGIKKDRTKDCDLEYPQKWYLSCGYYIAGVLMMPFLK